MAVRQLEDRVVGLSFVAGYPENVQRLEQAVVEAELAAALRAGRFGTPGQPRHEPLAAVLVRAPENPHDANAVEVHVEGIGMIGHLRRDAARLLAGPLDHGVRYAASITRVEVHPDHPDRPGITIFVEREGDDDPDQQG